MGAADRAWGGGAWGRFWRNPGVSLSVAALVLVGLAAVAGPALLGSCGGEVSADPSLQFQAPSRAHPFGTDLNGRDLLCRVLIGARVSLVVGMCGALISLGIGCAYGLVSGYCGGRVDAAMMRVVDVLYAIPRLVFVLILIHAAHRGLQEALHGWFHGTAFGWIVGYSKIVLLILCLGLIEWLTMARIVRGQVLALKNRTFVLAARALGQGHARIMVRHLLPNLRGVILVYLTLTIPAVIIDESFLSFLGLGVDATQASWGKLLSDGARAINPVESRWWLLAFPAVAMSVTLLALNFLGDGLRDALDPRSGRGQGGGAASGADGVGASRQARRRA